MNNYIYTALLSFFYISVLSTVMGFSTKLPNLNLSIFGWLGAMLFTRLHATNY